MLEEAVSRIIEGSLSGIGLGFVFYLYPVIRHTFSEKYRYKFRFEEDGKLLFRKETIKYLKIGFFLWIYLRFYYGNYYRTIWISKRNIDAFTGHNYH